MRQHPIGGDTLWVVAWLVEPFSLGFMQRALFAGLLAGLTCSLVGVWVVLRRVAFLGDALGHGIVPGVAVAYLIGIAAPIGAAVAAAVMVGGITVVSRQRRLGEDTGIGLLFIGMLALGVIIISSSSSFVVDVSEVLFGSVLGVGPADLWLSGIASLAVLVITVAGYRAFLVLTFDERKAEVLGLRPRTTQTALLGLVALAVIASFQTVGALLVFALLVGPAASAALVVRRVPSMMALATALAWSAVVIGLLASYHGSVAAGGAIAVAAVLQFFAVAAVLGVRNRGAVPSTDRTPPREPVGAVA